MTRILLSFLSLLLILPMQAQQASSSAAPEMAELFYREGKIYVVLSVIAIIFVCLLLFLVYLERKLSRLEKNRNENQ